MKTRKKALGDQGIEAAEAAAANARDVAAERILSPAQAVQLAIERLERAQRADKVFGLSSIFLGNLLSGLRWALACLKADPEGWMPIDSEHGPLVGEQVELAIPTRLPPYVRIGFAYTELAGPFRATIARVPEGGVQEFTRGLWASEPASHWRPRTRGPRYSQ
jgi:hypothetical protein